MPIVGSSTILWELLEYPQPQLLRILKQNCASIILYNINKNYKIVPHHLGKLVPPQAPNAWGTGGVHGYKL